MAAEQSGGIPGTQSRSGGGAVPEAMGAFGPTQRPNEPPTVGQVSGSPLTLDPDMAMRILYSKFPHPNIERMLRKAPDYR